MYVKKDFLKLKTDELTDYTAKGFALCYVEKCERLDINDEHDDRTHVGLRLFFTNADLKDQWGDDWNDAPYDCNAGWPYDDTHTADGNGGWIKHEHTILVLNVSLSHELWMEMPEDFGGYCSVFSVDSINEGACAWLFFHKEAKPIYAGATPLDVLERIGKWMHECPVISDEYDEC